MSSKPQTQQMISPPNTTDDQPKGHCILIGRPPTTQEKRRCEYYEWLKTIQTTICFLFIIYSTIWLIVERLTNWNPTKRGDKIGFWYNFNLLESPWNTLILYNGIASALGLIGAFFELLFLQIIYALMVTFFFPYSVLPWVIVIGMCNGWNSSVLYRKAILTWALEENPKKDK